MSQLAGRISRRRNPPIGKEVGCAALTHPTRCPCDHVSFGAHNGLNAGIALCPFGAMNKLMPRKKPRAKINPYSITLSAVASRFGGTVRPSALAVLRLMSNSYFDSCSTGRVPGGVPRKILSTYAAPRRASSLRSAAYASRPPPNAPSLNEWHDGKPWALAMSEICLANEKVKPLGQT